MQELLLILSVFLDLTAALQEIELESLIAVWVSAFPPKIAHAQLVVWCIYEPLLLFLFHDSIFAIYCRALLPPRRFFSCGTFISLHVCYNLTTFDCFFFQLKFFQSASFFSLRQVLEVESTIFTLQNFQLAYHHQLQTAQALIILVTFT